MDKYSNDGKSLGQLRKPSSIPSDADGLYTSGCHSIVRKIISD